MAFENHIFDKFLNNGTGMKDAAKTYEEQLFNKYCSSVKAQEIDPGLVHEMGQVFPSASRFSTFESENGESFFLLESLDGEKFTVIGGRTADIGKIFDGLEGGL
jgi:hypothetical protein